MGDRNLRPPPPPPPPPNRNVEIGFGATGREWCAGCGAKIQHGHTGPCKCWQEKMDAWKRSQQAVREAVRRG